MIRATTGGVLRSYRYNLMNSFITDNKARETVLTQRVFNSYAEDPAAAAKSFRLRKSRMMTSSQLKICDNTYHKYQGAFASLQTVSELIDTENSSSSVSTLKDAALRMLNDPTGDARTQLNKVLDNLSDTIIQNMNQTYGDEFIFAGADGHNVPFTVEEVNGKKQLYYRGIPVDAAKPELTLNADQSKVEVQLEDKTTGAVAPLDPNDATYLRQGVELLDASKVQEVERETNGDPVTLYGTDGNVYYLLKKTPQTTGMDETAFEAYMTQVETDYRANNPAATDEEVQAAVDEERAKFTETFEFVEPLPANPRTYYMAEDLVLKDEFDTVDDSIMRDENGNAYTVTVDGTKSYLVKGSDDCFVTESEYAKACSDAKKLEYLANEKRFVDIGLGFQEDENGKLIESSAFNECLSGLTFLGYGVDEEGDPKNIYSLVQRLKDIAANAPQEGKWDKATYDEFDRLVGKLEDASDEFKTQFTNQSAGTEKLKNNYDLLEDNVYNLKEQYSNLEDVNMADAISSLLWAEYCYNAALKVGNSVLSQSLMDYLQ